MLLKSHIEVMRSLEIVNLFFDVPGNLAKWDRRVREVIVTSSIPVGIGFTFDTISPSEKRMSYRIVDYVRGKRNRIALVEDPTFESAIWMMSYKELDRSTRIDMSVEFRPRRRYFFLNVILFFMKHSLFTDLKYLKSSIENYQVEVK